jgi:hypothetical protein
MLWNDLPELAPGQWHHIAITQRDGVRRTYVGGRLVAIAMVDASDTRPLIVEPRWSIGGAVAAAAAGVLVALAVMAVLPW